MVIKKKQPNASLKALRASYGLSMAVMAKILGISETSYLAKENKERLEIFGDVHDEKIL